MSQIDPILDSSVQEALDSSVQEALDSSVQEMAVVLRVARHRGFRRDVAAVMALQSEIAEADSRAAVILDSGTASDEQLLALVATYRAFMENAADLINFNRRA